MATNSTISVVYPDKTVATVYCHFDGQRNGKILDNFYNSQTLAERLISFGDMSYLGRFMDLPEGIEHSFEKPSKGICVFYCRDRKEDLHIMKWNSLSKLIDTDFHCEYNYVFVNGKWVKF